MAASIAFWIAFVFNVFPSPTAPYFLISKTEDVISLSKETGKSTIFENKEIYKKKLLHEALESEVYKKIKENFPDAELSDVEEVK